jgi:adenosylcobinamide-GDP ribazoletransferase
MKEQLHIFLNALMFYTRIPVPGWMKHDAQMLNKATVYFPFIGWIVGGTSWGIWALACLLLPPEVAVLLSMAAGILLTGAFHEDGFADVCDGFGGGWTKSRILEIMKDSRVGTYAVAGLVLLLLLKFELLLALGKVTGALSFTSCLCWILPHSLSRFTAATFIYTHSYVREDAESKAKPVAQKLSLLQLAMAGLFGLLPMLGLMWLMPTPWLLLVLPTIWLVKAYLGWYFNKWIGGYTGDCLGAAQQLAEVLLYLVLLVAFRLPVNFSAF